MSSLLVVHRKGVWLEMAKLGKRLFFLQNMTENKNNMKCHTYKCANNWRFRFHTFHSISKRVSLNDE